MALAQSVADITGCLCAFFSCVCFVSCAHRLCLDIDNSEDCKITEKTKPKPSIDWKSFKDMGEPVTKCEAP